MHHYGGAVDLYLKAVKQDVGRTNEPYMFDVLYGAAHQLDKLTEREHDILSMQHLIAKEQDSYGLRQRLAAVAVDPAGGRITVFGVGHAPPGLSGDRRSRGAAMKAAMRDAQIWLTRVETALPDPGVRVGRAGVARSNPVGDGGWIVMMVR